MAIGERFLACVSVNVSQVALDLSAAEEPILKPENWEENVATCISPNYEVYLSFVSKLILWYATNSIAGGLRANILAGKLRGKEKWLRDEIDRKYLLCLTDSQDIFQQMLPVYQRLVDVVKVYHLGPICPKQFSSHLEYDASSWQGIRGRVKWKCRKKMN